MISPTVFCRALRRVLTALGQGLGQGLEPGQGLGPGPGLVSSTSSANPGPGSSTSLNRPLVLVGYSQGGRLAMHYRALFPLDVAALVGLSAVQGKNKDRWGYAPIVDTYPHTPLTHPSHHYSHTHPFIHLLTHPLTPSLSHAFDAPSFTPPQPSFSTPTPPHLPLSPPSQPHGSRPAREISDSRMAKGQQTVPPPTATATAATTTTKHSI